MTSSSTLLRWELIVVNRARNLWFFPWIIGVIIVLMIICWSVRQLAIHFYRAAASYFGAEIIIYYGTTYDTVCFLGGYREQVEWNCGYDWPYETILAILTFLLIALLVTWIVLSKKWRLSFRPSIVHFDVKTSFIPKFGRPVRHHRH